jgi:hypothetical protein
MKRKAGILVTVHQTGLLEQDWKGRWVVDSVEEMGLLVKDWEEKSEVRGACGGDVVCLNKDNRQEEEVALWWIKEIGTFYEGCKDKMLVCGDAGGHLYACRKMKRNVWMAGDWARHSCLHVGKWKEAGFVETGEGPGCWLCCKR